MLGISECRLPPIIETASVEDSKTPPASTSPEGLPDTPRKVEVSDSSPDVSHPPILEQHKKTSPRSWLWQSLSLLISVLWLAPIITLLVLNFKAHVIGASVWCPFGRCFSNAFSSNAISTAVQLDHRDHDVLTGLQFLAQAFEVWFLVIATCLLYDVGMLFARSREGLPLGFMLAHLEFKDITFVFNPYLWTSAFPGKNPPKNERRRRSVIRLFLFASLAALVTIVTALMDAAIAVLLLPSLSWTETEKLPQQKFNSIATSQSPHGDIVFAGSCNNTQLFAGNYSCTSELYGSSLDKWAATAQSSIQQVERQNGVPVLATSQEAAVQFALNASTDSVLIWVANRQLLRDISNDYLNTLGISHDRLSAIEDDGSADPRFKSSLQTVLQRNGPSLGFQSNCMAGNVSVTTVGDGKKIHCFNKWTLNNVETYTKVRERLVIYGNTILN